jgi:hypothetical protein
MFQGEGGYQSVVGPKTKAKLPGPAIEPLIQGQPNKPKSDMQVMQENERRQHEQTYIYEHGHNDGSAPLGKGSF